MSALRCPASTLLGPANLPLPTNIGVHVATAPSASSRSIELGSGLVNLLPVLARPGTQRIDRSKERAAELSQLVIHARRYGREHGSRHQAVALQAAQCQRE